MKGKGLPVALGARKEGENEVARFYILVCQTGARLKGGEAQARRHWCCARCRGTGKSENIIFITLYMGGKKDFAPGNCSRRYQSPSDFVSRSMEKEGGGGGSYMQG